MVIAIEGISGAGKSTLIKKIQTQFKDKKILVIKHDYYDSIIRKSIDRSHHETVLLFLTLHKHIQNEIEKQKNNYDLILLDRSIVSTLVYGDLYTENFCYEFLHFFKYQEYPIDKIFVLSEDIQTCFNRIKKKDRYETVESMTKYQLSYQDPALINILKFIMPNTKLEQLNESQITKQIEGILK